MSPVPERSGDRGKVAGVAEAEVAEAAVAVAEAAVAEYGE
jgi:hypothetical protein